MRLSFGPLRVAVQSAEPAHLGWLAEFLAPWFAVDEGGPADVTVTLQHAGTVPSPPAGSAAAPVCFVLDSRVVRHPAWRPPAGGWTVHDGELAACYRVAPGGSRVDVLAHGSAAAARVALMRVVREHAMAAALGAGALLLHAAAVVRAGRALLLVGPKRAGKTTLLLRALELPGAAYLANDRVVAWVGETAAVRGMPSIVSVRPDVLARHPVLAARLRGRGYHHAVTCAEAVPWGDGDGPAGAAADLSPIQLCAALDVPAAAEAPIRAVVFPEAAPGAGRLRLDPISADEALRRLADGLFGQGTARSEVFAVPGAGAPPDAADVRARSRRLLAGVPAFACRFDPATLEDAEARAAVAAALR